MLCLNHIDLSRAEKDCHLIHVPTPRVPSSLGHCWTLINTYVAQNISGEKQNCNTDGEVCRRCNGSKALKSQFG